MKANTPPQPNIFVHAYLHENEFWLFERNRRVELRVETHGNARFCSEFVTQKTRARAIKWLYGRDERHDRFYDLRRIKVLIEQNKNVSDKKRYRANRRVDEKKSLRAHGATSDFRR